MVLARLVGPSKDAVVPFDEPTWMDGVGEAIYERSGALGKAIGEHAATLGAALGRRRTPALRRAEASVEREDAPFDDPTLDDLEARFAALERRMGGDG
jgi:hypothetical protein